MAIFVTAGEGPIPTSVLAARLPIDKSEELIDKLPERGDCEILVQLPRPDDFIGFSRRGLYAYDWQDVHRSTPKATNCYELISRPNTPLRFSQLKGELVKWASYVKFGSLEFSKSHSINIREHLDCMP